MLRGRLVCGINHERNQQHLLHEGSTLYLEKALDIAFSLELAIYQTAVIQSGYMLSVYLLAYITSPYLYSIAWVFISWQDQWTNNEGSWQ